jgi:hypothetical protein
MYPAGTINTIDQPNRDNFSQAFCQHTQTHTHRPYPGLTKGLRHTNRPPATRTSRRTKPPTDTQTYTEIRNQPHTSKVSDTKTNLLDLPKHQETQVGGVAGTHVQDCSPPNGTDTCKSPPAMPER